MPKFQFDRDQAPDLETVISFALAQADHGIIKISPSGHVWRLAKLQRHGDHLRMIQEEAAHLSKLGPDGRMYVAYAFGPHRIHIPVERLVYAYYYGVNEPDLQIDHLDGHRCNDNPRNLQVPGRKPPFIRHIHRGFGPVQQNAMCMAYQQGESSTRLGYLFSSRRQRYTVKGTEETARRVREVLRKYGVFDPKRGARSTRARPVPLRKLFRSADLDQDEDNWQQAFDEWD